MILDHALKIRYESYSAFGKSLCPYKRCWKWCPRASVQAWTRLILLANTFCRSAREMFLVYAIIAVFNSLSVRERTITLHCSLHTQMCKFIVTYFDQLLWPSSGRCSWKDILHHVAGNAVYNTVNLYTGWHKKNGNFWKTQQKFKKSKKKNLLTEIEPLQLAF